MRSKKNREISYADNMWIISKGRYTDLDLKGIHEGSKTGPILEHRISDLARYMLNPNPIEVGKKLVGCQVYYHKASSNKIKDKIRNLFHGLLKGRNNLTELLISDCEIKVPSLKDRNLESHFNKIYELLRSYDSIFKRLSQLDHRQIFDVLGLCEDVDGSRSWLNLQGSIDEKIEYIENFIRKDVGIMLEKAYIADGLFEMRGFDFKSYDSKKSYRLIKLLQDGLPKFCVLGSNNRIEYWIDDNNLVYYMHLLEQTIKTNTKLNESFNQCTKGDAKPLKIFFNKQLEIAYSRVHLPKIYREVFKTYNMDLSERDALMNSLNNLQLGVSFNYVPKSNSGEEKLFTNLSIMHDVRALDPIKDNLPQLYAEINKRVSVSEAGRFYLLDSLGGYKDE